MFLATNAATSYANNSFPTATTAAT
jgi:hypothetical protein